MQSFQTNDRVTLKYIDTAADTHLGSVEAREKGVEVLILVCELCFFCLLCHMYASYAFLKYKKSILPIVFAIFCARFRWPLHIFFFLRVLHSLLSVLHVLVLSCLLHL